MMTTPTAAEYAVGLRLLADLLEANPGLPHPMYLKEFHAWYAHSVEEVRAIGFAAARERLPVTKEYSDDWDSFKLRIECGPITVQALAARSTVCERVLVGTETVTDHEPDPSAPLVTIPDPTVTKAVERTVEKYEWRCAPIGESGEDVAA